MESIVRGLGQLQLPKAVFAQHPSSYSGRLGGVDKVAFTAVAEYGGAVGPKTRDTTLVFNSVITNVGGYNQNTGVFTAPFPGLYYFTFTYRGGSQTKTGLQLINGDKLVVQSFDDFEKSSNNTSDNAGHSAILHLQEDDEVFVRLPAGRQVWAADKSTSFSGFLVSRG